MTTYEDLQKTYEACEKALDYDLSVRLRRSLSWLQRAERETDDIDASFIFHWISFNAAYAGGYSKRQDYKERDAFNRFFEKLVRHDTDKKIYSLMWDSFSQEVRGILNNQYILSSYWNEDKPDDTQYWSAEFAKDTRKVNRALAGQKTIVILSILFQRIYVLRNQMFHGSATWQGTVNRSQVIDCQKLIANITPLFIEIMLRYPEKDWGKLQVPSKPR